MTRVLIFTGAPSSAALAKTAPSELLNDLSPSIARFAGAPAVFERPPQPSTPATTPGELRGFARWRSLPLEKNRHLPTGFSQLHHAGFFQHLVNNSPQFFNTASLSFVSSDDGGGEGRGRESQANHVLLSQFYEQAHAVHEDVVSPSQVNDPPEDDTTEVLTSFLTEDTTNTSSFADSPSGAIGVGGGHLSDLEDLPTAEYLMRVQPATVTVNLIVGIISIRPPRAVSTRWGERRLVEVLVGDESCSGFQITFWLDGYAEKKNKQPHGEEGADGDSNQEGGVLSTLRPQDIVLVQNVALNVFMKKVYGSSLRRGRTSVHLLHRVGVDAGNVRSYYSRRDLRAEAAAPRHPQIEKTRRVRDWVLKFVAGAATTGNDPEAPVRMAWDQPPPHETQ